MNRGVPLRTDNAAVTLAPWDRAASSPKPGAPTAVICTGPVVGGTTNVSTVRLWVKV